MAEVNMRKRMVFVLIIFIFCLHFLAAAVFKGESIDGKNVSAQLWLKDETQRYNVSVVFVKNEARIVFAPNQVLPIRFSENMHLTLYLRNEQIEDPEQVPLLELIPPETSAEADNNTKNWKIAAYWFMNINLQ
jgi:hypothetical protein